MNDQTILTTTSQYYSADFLPHLLRQQIRFVSNYVQTVEEYLSHTCQYPSFKKCREFTLLCLDLMDRISVTLCGNWYARRSVHIDNQWREPRSLGLVVGIYREQCEELTRGWSFLWDYGKILVCNVREQSQASTRSWIISTAPITLQKPRRISRRGGRGTTTAERYITSRLPERPGTIPTLLSARGWRPTPARSLLQCASYVNPQGSTLLILAAVPAEDSVFFTLQHHCQL